MARVKAIAVGYYKHRLVQPGEIISVKEVDEKGFYLKIKGKEGKQRKCAWLDHVGTEADKPIDPKLVAETISGKNPGNAFDDAADADESDEVPAKGK